MISINISYKERKLWRAIVLKEHVELEENKKEQRLLNIEFKHYFLVDTRISVDAQFN